MPIPAIIIARTIRIVLNSGTTATGLSSQMLLLHEHPVGLVVQSSSKQSPSNVQSDESENSKYKAYDFK